MKSESMSSGCGLFNLLFAEDSSESRSSGLEYCRVNDDLYAKVGTKALITEK
jgi:hypothetical protein